MVHLLQYVFAFEQELPNNTDTCVSLPQHELYIGKHNTRDIIRESANRDTTLESGPLNPLV